MEHSAAINERSISYLAGCFVLFLIWCFEYYLRTPLDGHKTYANNIFTLVPIHHRFVIEREKSSWAASYVFQFVSARTTNKETANKLKIIVAPRSFSFRFVLFRVFKVETVCGDGFCCVPHVHKQERRGKWKCVPVARKLIKNCRLMNGNLPREIFHNNGRSDGFWARARHQPPSTIQASSN